MVKKLKRKFAAIAMLSVFIVLLLIMGAINTVSFFDVVRTAEDRITFLTVNGDSAQDAPPALPARGEETMTPPEKPETATGQSDNAAAFRGRRFFGDRFDLNAEAHFDSRYFTVVTSADGETQSVELGRIAAVDETEAAEMAKTVRAAGKTAGFSGNFRFRVTQTDADTFTILFLDCSRELNTFYSFLTASVLVSFAGLALIFILVLVFSGAAVRPMAESYEKQKRFITDASHELKTPLAVINADTEVLEITAGESEWTQSIKNQVRRLSSLTDKLVMLSRMDEEAYKPVMTDFDLSAAVAEVAASFEAVAVSRNKRYTAEIEPGLRMTGEESAIRQLTSLLIDNAMKYSDDGGVIRVALRKNGRSRELTVRNTVEEIKKGKHDELFERFYRADASRTSKTGGHGIGLSVVKAIAAVHKGKVSAVSEDGKSIVFTCTF